AARLHTASTQSRRPHRDGAGGGMLLCPKAGYSRSASLSRVDIAAPAFGASRFLSAASSARSRSLSAVSAATFASSSASRGLALRCSSVMLRFPPSLLNNSAGAGDFLLVRPLHAFERVRDAELLPLICARAVVGQQLELVDAVQRADEPTEREQIVVAVRDAGDEDMADPHTGAAVRQVPGEAEDSAVRLRR